MDPRKTGPITKLRGFNWALIAAICIWTAVCAGSMMYHVYDSKKHIGHLVRETAMKSVEKDLLFRFWAAGHGGVYVLVTETTPPNPHLATVKERDITTPSGRRLTLMNPAYMIRQVHELGRDFTGVQGHITSLKPIRPENAPDAWEAQALRKIEAGAKTFGEKVDHQGQPYYRLMYPLIIAKPCLTCHAAQGYKLGDLRGGISASVPLKDFDIITRDHKISEAKHFGAIWVLGLVGVSLVAPFVRRRVEEREKAEEALRQSWSFTQSIIENEPECVKILGPNGELKFMNRAGLAMIDAGSLDDVLGRQIHELVVPEHREAFSRLSERAISGESGTIEFEMVGLRGTRRWLETHAVPHRSADGTREVLGITRDVTERKRAEEALRESEARLRQAQHIGRFGNWEWTVATGQLWWSSEAYELFGMDPRRGIAFKRFLDRIHPDDRQRVHGSIQDAVQRSLTSWQIEYRIVLDSGEVRHFYENATADRDPAGKVLRRRGIVQDITERKRVELELVGALKLNQTLIDSLPYPSVLIRYPDRTIIAANRPARENGADVGKVCYEGFQIDFDKALGRNFCVSCRAEEMFARQEPVATQELYAKERWWTVYWIPVDRETYLHFSIDITERKKLEQQLLQAQKIESVGRLAGGIAHDINNMLTPILGYAELLSYKIPAGDVRHDDLAEITGAASRVRDMTRQLLAFARKQTLDIARLDVNAVVSGFAKILHITVRENISIAMRLAPSVRTIQGDRSQLEQVLMNLAVNAQDAMPDGGTLTITTREIVADDGYVAGRPGMAAGDYVQLLISDTGIGMDEETRAKIFDPFFTTKEAGRGTGLGLATVYGIVKQHGGYIEVRSTPGAGAEFIISLPVNEEPVDAAGNAAAVQRPRGTETVLLVEDQEQVLRLVSLMLRESGYQVLTAQSGQEALAKAGSFDGEIHLMISDVIMPEMNGKELFERVREIRNTIRVLYMSGYPAEVISSQGVLDGGIDFIRKPFSVHDFAMKVRQVLDSRGA
ncbi:MAG: PAS domain-containing protein [Nitrospirota bacterium]